MKIQRSILFPLCLIVSFVLSISCGEKPNTLKEEICQTWVLIKKDKNNMVEELPADDRYPVTLTCYSSKVFKGKHDVNAYDGKYSIEENTITFSDFTVTDASDTDWFWEYISELKMMHDITITDKNKMQLSNNSKTVSLYFMNKTLFEKEFFKLEEGYGS